MTVCCCICNRNNKYQHELIDNVRWSFTLQVGVEGLSYAANHGLNIRHPDGHMYNHTIPEDYKIRLSALDAELKQKVQKHGAWVEYKDLLVAWHYR